MVRVENALIIPYTVGGHSALVVLFLLYYCETMNLCRTYILFLAIFLTVPSYGRMKCPSHFLVLSGMFVAGLMASTVILDGNPISGGGTQPPSQVVETQTLDAKSDPTASNPQTQVGPTRTENQADSSDNSLTPLSQ